MKKKIMTISVILCCLILLGVFLWIAFGESQKNAPASNNKKPETVEDKYKDTPYDLILDGKSDFVIVYPENHYYGTNIQEAAVKIQTMVEEATGVNLSIQSDAECVSDGKIISLGETKLAASNSILQDTIKQNELGQDGYVISTQDDIVYLIGGADSGTLYASQEFLKIHFNYEYYAEDCYSLNKGVESRKLKDVSLVDIPDFESRTPTAAMYYTSDYRCVPYTAKFNNVDGNSFVHNWFGTTYSGLLPKWKYEGEHPKWYDTTGTQLCLECYGDEGERQKLRETVVQEMVYRLERQPECDWISFSHNDGGLWCGCDTCKAIAAEYGSANTGAFVSLIRFVNMIAKDIKEWNVKNCPERDITIFIYDYGTVQKPPVKMDEKGNPIQDENGNYMPLSEELMLADNIAAFYCFNFNSTASEVDSFLTSSVHDEAKRLTAVMKEPKFYLWSYSACFDNYLLPYEKISWIKEQYVFGKSINAIGYFDQGRFNGQNFSDWEHLAGYVSSKLLWDTTLEVEPLVEDFFDNYFLDASDAMYDLYKDHEAHMGWLSTQGIVGEATLDAKYWPYRVLKGFLDKIDVAYEAIEHYKKTDPELYDTLYNRINLESMSYRYLEIYIFPQYYSLEKYDNMKKLFVDDCHKLNINLASEAVGIDNLFVN